MTANDTLLRGPWGEPVTTLESEPFSALRGVVRFWAREGACRSLEVTGRCPREPGEVLMLAADVEKTGAMVGRRVRLSGYETSGVRALGLPRPGFDKVVVVGTYATSATAEDWLAPIRVTSTNEQGGDGGGYQPYAPAPLITTRATVEAAGSWTVRVDTALGVPANLTTVQLDEAAASASAISADGRLEVDGGTLADDSTNSLAMVAKEVRDQETTARSSIAPAVLSLVLGTTGTAGGGRRTPRYPGLRTRGLPAAGGHPGHPPQVRGGPRMCPGLFARGDDPRWRRRHHHGDDRLRPGRRDPDGR